VRIEPLTAQHVRSGFDCGEPSLNDYLQRFARQNDERSLGRTYVLVSPGQPQVLGYYTISCGYVAFDTIPEKLPRYPIPVVHLGRLAVDVRMHGQGAGKMLLLDALRQAVRVSEYLGIYAVEVRALHDRARSFYLKYGFAPLLDDPLHLYLTLKTIRKLGLV
jgi:GNAT superfamily N-acetyltransferase